LEKGTNTFGKIGKEVYEMKQLKVNRTMDISLDNIKKFVLKKNGYVWVYKKKGYPPILKCREGLSVLKTRLVNLGKTIFDFELEEE